MNKHSEQQRIAALEEALRECRRLADESKNDFESNQHKWLASIYTAANAVLLSSNGDSK
jgi:hypothetical protein